MKLGRARNLLPTLLLLGGACTKSVPDGPYARAKVIEGLDETIGGEMGMSRPADGVQGLPGDFLLENDRFRVAILSGRNSKGPGLYGGSIVDADLQRGDSRFDGGRGRDLWNEMFPLASMNVPFATPDFEGAQPTVFVPKGAEGSEDSAAIVRVHALGAPFLTLLDLLWGIVRMPDMWMTTDYIAEPGAPWLTVRTTVTFEDNGPVLDGTPVDYPDDALPVIDVGLIDGIVLGDFFLAGGSVDVFAPGIGFDEDGAVFRRTEAGDNIFADPFVFPWVAATGDGVSYGIVPRRGKAFIPLFTASQTAVVGGMKIGDADALTCAQRHPDNPAVAFGDRFCIADAFTYERYFLIGKGDVGSILDQVIEVRNKVAEEDGDPSVAIAFGEVHGRVLEQGTGLPMSGIDVFVFEPGAEFPFSQWRTDVGVQDDTPDGWFGGRLPVGTWELLVHQQGRPDGKRVRVDVKEGKDHTVRLEALRGGVLSFTIRDETGEHVPAKLTVLRADPKQASSLVPALGDGFIAGSPEWVVFSPEGTGEVPLPPGRYVAVASRGLEYEIDRSEPFRIDAKTGVHVDLQVVRSLETQGWISADLHVHSAPSHDSGVTLPTRVATMVAEGMEFFSSTDHDFIVDFAPVVESMRLEPWLQTAVGVETTTVELGHFLAFPLQQDFLGDVGGAMDWTGMEPVDILETLREQGRAAGFEPLVFVAHPRDGILGYFDEFGFDPFDGVPASGDVPAEVIWNSKVGGLLDNPNPILRDAVMDLSFDALEMFTGKRLDTHRTPLVSEAVAYADGSDTRLWPWISRTLEEQQALIDGTDKLTEDLQGVIDDWFTLLNLGYRITAIGNSDTHGTSSIEAGCPRNYVMSSTDDPTAISDQEIADAVRDHHVVASFGPFVRMWARSGGKSAIIGDELDANGPVELEIEVQAPLWVDVDHIELYENGTLIDLIPVDADPVSPLRFAGTRTVEPQADAWYVAIVAGDGSMSPVFTAVEIPYIPLDEAVTGALGGVPGVGVALGDPVGFPKVYPVHPYAITNPIWVDVGGDGWQAPGLPAWLEPGALP
ncbi:MAG: CehA/McbA family metallohydrolase [Alphaproteobacteria bacterium]|nr:CehA/McbA family metallohydrolase [Alphaproteobacteria bacterium]